MANTFSHLITHSEWSLLEAVPKVEQLVQRAKAMGQESLALSDHNRTSGLILFYLACREQGLKPILGLELSEAKNPGERITLLAKNAEGYGDLCELSSLRMMDPKGFRFEKAFARAWPHLFLLSSHPRCLQILCEGPNFKGKKLNKELDQELSKEFINKNNVNIYGVLINHDQKSRQRSRHIETLCTTYGLPLLAANDVYFLNSQDWGLHQMLRAIDLNSSLSRLKEGETVSPQAWFCDEGRMHELFPRHAEAIFNSKIISDQCNVTLELNKWIMPRIDVPKTYTPDSYLGELAHQGLWVNYGNSPHYAKAREIQEMELKTIAQLGYSSYFLMVKEIREWAGEHLKSAYRKPRDCTILRGSAANSITFYNLQVSDLDPIECNLYFQRFLNEDRASPPDADLDFGWDERELVLDHVVKRFGREHVAITCTTNHFRHRAAFREVAKVLGFSEEQVSRILESHETKNGQLRDEQIAEVSHWAEQIKGRPRFLGQHPGGVLITNKPIWRHVGCEWSGGEKNRLITQIDMHNGIDELGLIKFDLLGNGSISVFRDTLAQLEQSGIPDPKISKPEQLQKCFDDLNVSDLMARGRTRGIFYIESPAQMRLNKKAQAGSFAEITITSSLVRPAGATYTKTFIERHRKMKLGIQDWEFLHPSLEPILKETHDVCAYQEDVTKICHHVAGLSYKKADQIRKMMNSMHEGALTRADLERVAQEFIQGSQAHAGLNLTQATELWSRVSSFTGFSFCKSHSASYAQLSFQCTYLKAYYPAQFLSAVLSNNHGFYSRDVYIDEARRWGLNILPMHINESQVKYAGKDTWIRPGLLHIRSLNSKSKQIIVTERQKSGPFQDFIDFLSRVSIGKSEVERLILVGAFDYLGLSQPELLFLLQSEYGKIRSDQPSLLTSLSPGDTVKRLPNLGNYSLMQRCLNELYLLGYMLSGNLLSVLELHPAARDAVSAEDLKHHIGKRIKVFGSPITQRMHWVEKSGRSMKFMTLQDYTESIEVIFWPNVLERYEDLLLETGPFEVWGKVTEDWDAITLEAERLRKVTWSPNVVDFGLASEKLKHSYNTWKPYNDINQPKFA